MLFGRQLPGSKLVSLPTTNEITDDDDENAKRQNCATLFFLHFCFRLGNLFFLLSYSFSSSSFIFFTAVFLKSPQFDLSRYLPAPPRRKKDDDNDRVVEKLIDITVCLLGVAGEGGENKLLLDATLRFFFFLYPPPLLWGSGDFVSRVTSPPPPLWLLTVGLFQYT